MRERARMVGRLGLVAAITLLMAPGCNPLPITVAARPLSPIAVGEIRRIAVLRFTAVGLTADRAVEPGAEPLAEPPEVTVMRAVVTAMRDQPDWQLVDELTVGEAFRQLFGEVRPPTPSEARAVGTLLRADAVLRGEVTVFEERIGSAFAAKRPAHVVFALELLRPRDRELVWQAEYAEQQRALSENLWKLPSFVRADGTWVRAGELAQLGATQTVTRLHTALYGSSPKKPATSTRR